MKKHTLTWWKKKAKKTFQKWVRLRDADKHGFCKCCTCGTIKHWKKCDGGHFIPAEWLATCFIEHNCHSQCKSCNGFLEGNKDEYFIFMEKKYGRGTVDQLIQQKHLNIKYTYSDYSDIIDLYTDKIIGLCKQKGIE